MAGQRSGFSVRSRRSEAVVLLPTYNEAATLPDVLKRLEASRRLLRFDVRIVDDSSPDGTARLAGRWARSRPWLSVLARCRREGLARAYQDAFRRCLGEGYRVLVTFDADGSHPAEKIPALIRSVAAGGADMAIGSRYVPGGRTVGWPWRRRLLSRMGSLYVRLWTGLPIRDATSGFVAYRSDCLRDLLTEPPACRGFGYTVEMKFTAWRRGWRLREIPIAFTERSAGGSKMNLRIVLEAWRRVLLLGLV